MPDLDSLVGTDAAFVARGTYLATHHPARFQPFIDGLAYQGIRIPDELAKLIKVPKPEPMRLTCARIALEMRSLFAANGCITDENVEQIAPPGTPREVIKRAIRVAQLERMAA